MFHMISIHALREESDPLEKHGIKCDIISIHALREESDKHSLYAPHGTGISIHALREESDALYVANGSLSRYFYPRSP